MYHDIYICIYIHMYAEYSIYIYIYYIYIAQIKFNNVDSKATHFDKNYYIIYIYIYIYIYDIFSSKRIVVLDEKA